MGEQAAARAAAAAAAAVLQVQLHVCCSACFGLSDFAARITVKFSLRGIQVLGVSDLVVQVVLFAVLQHGTAFAACSRPVECIHLLVRENLA